MTLLTQLWHQMLSLGAARLRSGLVDLALMGAILLCLLTAAGYGLQALHGVLRMLVGPAGASAMLAILLVIMALVLALWLSLRHRTGIPAAPIAAPLSPPDATTTPADLGTSAAFLAGFLLARQLF